MRMSKTAQAQVCNPDYAEESLEQRRECPHMADTARNAMPPVLPKAPQPPLSRPGATPDSDRAKKPRLAEPAATDQELTPGDRVEGLGNFGKPTGELGTVEQANEDDAVVKWDNDGRMRLRQPWLKKI
jgi:hypothetical protein